MLSLKAELLRKQEEVKRERKKSAFGPNKLAAPLINKPTKLHRKRKHADEDEKKPKIRDDRNAEESAMLAKSKQILEAKSKFYDRMVSGGGALNSDASCLVQFNKKKQNDRDSDDVMTDGSDDDESSVNVISYGDDDDGWTEFVDCLGRTRRCLKKGTVYSANFRRPAMV